MASAADFLKSYSTPAAPPGGGGPGHASTPSAAPTPAPKKSASDFLSSYGGKPVETKQPQHEEADEGRGYIADAADAFVHETSGAWKKLKADWEMQNPMSEENKKQFAQDGAWDYVKHSFDRQMAAGRLPIDAFAVAVSPIAGTLRAGIAMPFGKGMKALFELDPETKRLVKEGKIEDPGKAGEDAMMEGLSLAMPAKGKFGGIKGAMRLSRGKPAADMSKTQHLATRGGLDPEEYARRYAGRALKREGITKEEAIKKVSKEGQSISDIGHSGMIEAGEQAALHGEGRRLGADLYYEQRMKGREERMARTLDHLVTDQAFYESLETTFQERKAASTPLYEEAFEGGSHAALQQQFEGEFNTASRGVHEARQAVDDAQNRLTQANARHPGEGDNVYGTASRNQALKKAHADVAEAEAAWDAARDTRDASLERLRIAQEHEATGVKGGLWSPALDEFLGHQLFQDGIAKGMEIQRLEVLGTGKPPNLTEYALTKGPNGELIPSKVPNLRLLDTAKRGLDAIISEYPKDIRGNPMLDDYGRAVEGVRKRFVAELDHLTKDTNPAYKQARDTWSGPTRVMEAMHKGRDFTNMDPEEIAALLKDAPGDVHEGFKIGVARAMADQMTETASGTITLSRKIADTTAMQKRLRAALKDDKAADEIIAMAEQEIDWHKRGGDILGGSQTARRTKAGKEFEELGPVVDEWVDGVRHGFTGIAATVKTQMGRMGSQWIQDRIRGLSDARREALGKLIFSTNREDNIRALELMYDETAVTVPQVGKRRAILPGAAASSTPQQPGSGDDQ